ncbi:globin domain-containing protein [Nosocomiicoccus sp. HMSC059G07]|uniref:globin domain-containing protein n=1 Tax=Nosocomiicoccus sp. HMSC059G07 TaxID=1739531 RepID=UPI0008A103BC|nr:globin domain-containing protein [Nosocomiicoccus sp. HMSC059G07]OFO56461.1 flavohemoprotein [Nosocomiicoccus sp. HMSC059G07]
MLTNEEKDLVKATVPLLKEHGSEITSTFYQRMFENHDELLNMFNQTNQKFGDQPKALANTVLAAAEHIDNLEAIVPAVIGIGHKHRALNVKKEHYPIVGKYLLIGIKEVLGDVATDDIINAWAKYYNQIAQIFIDVEEKMYEEAAWDGFKSFTVKEKEYLTDDVIRFTVDNDEALPEILPGQYITVKVKPNDYPYEALRHYSICSINTTNGLQFAVKREGEKDEAGVVSHYLFDELNEGDMIELSAPAGDFLLDHSDEKLLFIAGGVGLTPIMSMVESAVKHNKDIDLIISTTDETTLPFKEELKSLKENVNINIRYTKDDGYLTANDISGYDDYSIYISGSLAFNQAMINASLDNEYDMSKVHYEAFGPRMSLAV